jgi:hypothetical protein
LIDAREEKGGVRSRVRLFYLTLLLFLEVGKTFAHVIP